MFRLKMIKKLQAHHRIESWHSMVLLGILIFLLTGCMANRLSGEGLNKQINVFGLALFSAHDDKNIRGIIPKKEPCLKGFEYIYDPLDISIGYGTNDRIRKITTRNKETSMFDIRVGDSFPKGKALILRAGFSEGDTPYKFVKDGYLFTLLVNDHDRVFGMTLEVLY